jgi:hypothetical protein
VPIKVNKLVTNELDYQIMRNINEKKETKKILKEHGKLYLFTEDRFEQVKAVMKHGMTKDAWLKKYLSLDPLNKAQWCADHLVKFVEGGHL